MTEDEMVGWHHQLNGREFESCPNFESLRLLEMVPACRGSLGGRRKAVRDRFTLQGGTGDFP